MPDELDCRQLSETKKSHGSADRATIRNAQAPLVAFSREMETSSRSRKRDNTKTGVR
jgi:hypothetical protein